MGRSGFWEDYRALWGAIGAAAAFGVAELTASAFNISSLKAHAATLWKAGMQKIAVYKSMLHGLTRGIISKLQGGRFLGGFMSGLSGMFDVGTQGYGGFVGRTAIMAIVGGTFSMLGGGKFASGALAGAFVHMFNAEFSWKALWKGLTSGMRRVGSKIADGTIGNDAVKGLKGGLNGYRQVRDHAPWYAKAMLKVGITSVEVGATFGFAKGIDQMYDMGSGAFSDTQPTSVAGYAGYYTRQYIDAFYILPAKGEAYNPQNLLPY